MPAEAHAPLEDSVKGAFNVTMPPKAGLELPSPAVPKFDLPVDSEYKAKKLKIHSFKAPHMRSFHLNWLSFFTSFFSTFAAAPLIPVIRNTLDLTKAEIGYSGIAAVTGTIFARIAMGSFCDKFGPRYGHAFLMMLTATPVFGMAVVETAAGFIAVRCLIGFSLGTFVACQFWSSVMFSPTVVGTANAVAGGWGNLGGGVTQLIMPLIYSGLLKLHPESIAWRYAYFIPGGMHVIVGLLILCFSQDLPLGNYRELEKTGEKVKGAAHREFMVAISNYRTWCLMLTYGYCFGVELTVDNMIAEYFFDQFEMPLTTAGYFGSIFGLCNIFSRAAGGILSDVIGRPYGIRGRLWWLWGIQTLGGVLCVVLGLVYESLGLTIAILVLFSIAVQAACGATYGVVPFISKRSLGLVCGFVGAGGNAGGAITQAIFFTGNHLNHHEGLKWMGVMIIGVTALIIPVYFPMWGGMFAGPKEGATEQDYYMSEFTGPEQERGLHNASMKFANESVSQRGMKRIKSEASMRSGAKGSTGNLKAVEEV